MRALIIGNEWSRGVPPTVDAPFHYIAVGAEVEVITLRPDGSAIVKGSMFDDPDCIILQDIDPEHFIIIKETSNAH